MLRQYANDYGSVFRWSNGAFQGVEATGIVAAASAIPVSGTATYTAIAMGPTSEIGGGKIVDRTVTGFMTLNFDFGAGSLSGRFAPELDPEWHDYQLDTVNFRDTICRRKNHLLWNKVRYKSPRSEQLQWLVHRCGRARRDRQFAFPYRSPLDGQTYQAGGAFVGAK